MSGITKRHVEDLTYEAVDANIVGGMVCVPSTTATESGDQGCTPAGAGAINVLGVANKDAVTAANRAALTSSTGPAPLGAFVTDASVPSATVTLYNNFFGNVVYAAGTALAYGDPIRSAASGTVTLASGADIAAGKKIGWCAQKGGVGTGGGTALARILV